MYRLSVPLINEKLTPQTRGVYLRQLQQAGVDRVFLVVDRCFDERWYPAIQARLGENVAWLRENAIEAGVWVGCTIGHGTTLAHQGNEMEQKVPFTLLTTWKGEQLAETYCPTDENFTQAICKLLQMVAQTGIQTILIDDDFRLAQHGGFCCACDVHMKRLSDLCGEKVSREALAEKVFSGKPSRYRNTWLQVQGDSLREFAWKMRQAVDQVNPGINLAMCSAHCVWDVDGTNPVELTKILAGENPPMLRLHGAPYWAAIGNKPLPAVFEIARMLAAFCCGEGFELMAEGDVYPRPRYVVPASYLELFDAVIRADGQHQGILKYMFNYCSGPDYDTGYLDRHARNQAVMEKLLELFAGGVNAGVRIHEAPNLMGQSDFRYSCCHDESPFPNGGILCARCGIPTVYTGRGWCDVAFGENARNFYVDSAENGLIIDATAAAILTERGVDVGMERLNGWISCSIGSETFLEQRESVIHCENGCRLAEGVFRSGVLRESTAVVNGEEKLFSYRYENAAGQRFLVFLFDASSVGRNSGLLYGYARQKQMMDGIRWLSGKPLAVSCGGNPDLYLLCREEENALTVGLFNCFADQIAPAVIELAEEYERVLWGSCPGALSGHQVILPHIPAFGFDFFRLEKK